MNKIRMKRIFILLILILFGFGLVGCNKEKIETDGIVIENVYIIESGDGSPIKNNSTVYVNDNTRIRYKIN